MHPGTPIMNAMIRNPGPRHEVVVAILDGPVDLAHPCFAGVDITEDGAFGSSGGDEAIRHGTQVASIIARLASHASIVSIPIFSSGADGRMLPTSQVDLARALNRALDMGAHIVNVSGGQLADSSHVDPRLESALKSCAARDILLVAATGNDACDCLHVPAAFPSTLAVGAIDEAGQPLPMSNWGEAYRDHGVVALGKDIPVALPGGGSGQASGTSYSAAIVSGKAAVLMGELAHSGERPSGKRVRDAILASAIDCSAQEGLDCHRLLSGRFDPAGALARLLGPDPDEAGAESLAPPPSSRSHDHLPHAAEGVGPYMPNEIATNVLEGLRPSGCACGGAGGTCDCGNKEGAPRKQGVTPNAATATEDAASSNANASAVLTYALGRIGVDFATEANRDSFVQRGVSLPEDPAQLLKHLEQEPWAAESVTWTLMQDTLPIYAIRPAGVFAARTYEQLASLLGAQSEGKVEIVAVPGYSGSSVTLMHGRKVPVLVPNLRGIASWKSADLVQSVAEKHGAETASGMANFLERVFHELRNLGTSPEERALNFVATQAINHAGIFSDAVARKMTLDSSNVARSPVSRPGSDCWDVKLVFFNPAERLTQARHVYRVTVDVSGLLPVRVGDVRHWDVF